MENRERYESLSAALLAEINGQITAAGLNKRSLAKRIDVDYNTLGRYLRGQRDIPMAVFYAVIEQLPISEATLLEQARERFDGKR